MTRPDPLAAFTAPLGNVNHLSAAPVQPTRTVAGHLPDPRRDGPRWAITPPEYPRHHLQRVESARGVHWFFMTGDPSGVLPADDDRRFFVIPRDRCPSPDYCDDNGCSANGCGYGGQRATAYFFDEGAAVPADPERYERPRGWGRQYLAAGVVAMAGAALVVAYVALLPW